MNPRIILASAAFTALLAGPARAQVTIDDGTSVTIPGTYESPWAVGGVLYVGYTTTGELTLADGGIVTNTNGYVAYEAGSTGTVTVTGTGSAWSNSANTYIGYGGAGALVIENGGAVTYSNLELHAGQLAGSTGDITVAGTNSSLTGGRLYIGAAGTASLTIENGGSVTSAGNTYIGSDATGAGTAEVTGSGSSWNVTSGMFYVANSGTGSLTIDAGASVATTQAYIGYAANSIGAATVKGTGSIWTIATSSLTVGRLGTATLNIEAGGTVATASGTLGTGASNNAAGTGTVTVTGEGSTWANNGGLTVGNYGTGILDIENGGTVSNTQGRLGYYGTGTGTVTVTGEGSTWVNSTGLLIGRAGTGTVNIEDGGTVTVSDGAGTVTLGSNAATASGTVNIGTGGAAGTLEAAEVTTGTGTGQVNFNHTGTVDFGAKLTGTLAVAKLGAGTTILTGVSTYTGATSVDAGSLLVNGSLGDTAVTVASGATFGGTGLVSGPVALEAGAILAPGSGSIGTFAAGDTTWAGGATYLWEISDASATSGTGWDLFSVAGVLALNATTADLFTISLTSLATEGVLAGFDAAQDYDFVIATATGGITGFDANAFALDLSGLGTGYTGSWSLGLSEGGAGLVLSYSAVPEPATCAALFGGAALAGALVWRRRRA